MQYKYFFDTRWPPFENNEVGGASADMSDRFSEILRESRCSGNYIPSGRQLHRTPPLSDVKRHLDFSGDDCENNKVQYITSMNLFFIKLYLTGTMCN